MSRLSKTLALVVGAIFLLIAALFSFVLWFIDPNSYKPQLEQAAREQGVELQLVGDLGLAVFPRLALTVGEIHFSSAAHNLPESSLASAALALDWSALLRGQVAVNALKIRAADVHFTRLEQASALAAPGLTADKPQSSATGDLAVAIDHIEIEDSRFTLNSGEAKTVLNNINFESRNINTQGRPFPLKTAFSYLTDANREDANAKPVQVQTQLQASFDGNSQQLYLKEIQADVKELLALPITLIGNANVNLATQEVNVHELKASVGTLALSGEMRVEHYRDNPTASGAIGLGAEELKTTLATLAGKEILTSNPGALQNLAASSQFRVTETGLQLDNIKLTLDDSNFQGTLNMTMAAPKNLQLNLHGSSLTFDDYLAPETAQGSEPTEATSGGQALFAPLLAAIAFLDGGNGTMLLSLDSLVAGGTTLTTPSLDISLAGKNVSINGLKTGIFGGEINAQAAIDLHGELPQLTFKQTAAHIDLLAALEHFTEDAKLSGTLDFNIEGSTKGTDKQALWNNLQGAGNLNIANPQLAAVNLEQSYCELAALVEKTPPRSEPWPQGTALNNLHSQFTLNGPILHLADYSTGVGNLKVRGDGDIDLDKEKFAVRVITRLEGETTSPEGCAVKSKRIRDRDIPLLCKDKFAKANARSCKPDPEFVQQLLQKELFDKLIDKDGNGNEKTKALEGLLKGLFKN